MNHIKTIEIKNFKSIRHQKIEDCRRINVFIGYPNTGKSNILEAIGGFSFLQFKDGDNFDLRSLMRVNNYPELFFDGNFSDDILIGINDKINLQYKIFDRQNIGLEIYDRNGSLENLLNFPENWENKQSLSSDTFFKAIFHGNESKNKDYLKFLRGPSSPQKFYSVKKYLFNNKNVGKKNSDNVHSLAVPDGNNFYYILSFNSQVREELSNILQEYNLSFVLDMDSETFKISKRLSNGALFFIPYHLLSDTLQRLIFYKAAIASNKDSILLFEEPEAYMFPPYISKFTSDIMYDENNNQYFIATHSPFVLNDFMEDIDKSDFSIYAVGYKKETGETTVHRLTDEEINEVYQYGVDLFFNLEDYLKNAVG